MAQGGQAQDGDFLGAGVHLLRIYAKAADPEPFQGPAVRLRGSCSSRFLASQVVKFTEALEAFIKPRDPGFAEKTFSQYFQDPVIKLDAPGAFPDGNPRKFKKKELYSRELRIRVTSAELFLATNLATVILNVGARSIITAQAPGNSSN